MFVFVVSVPGGGVRSVLLTGFRTGAALTSGGHFFSPPSVQILLL